MVIWAINATLTMNKTRKVLTNFYILFARDPNKYLVEYYHIMNFFSPFNYKNFFGFRHWFVKYKSSIPDDVIIDEDENLNSFV